MSWLARLGSRPVGVRIAPAAAAHVEELAAIHASAFARPWGAEQFEAFLADRAVRVDGLFLGRSRQPSGFVVSRSVLDEAEVLSVALARAARGRGHAYRLMAEHLQGLAHAGITRVHLEVEEGNDPALALYRRLGFVQSGLRPGYYARPDGSVAAARSMTRTLSDPAPLHAS